MITLDLKHINTLFYNQLVWNKCSLKNSDEQRYFANIVENISLKFRRLSGIDEFIMIHILQPGDKIIRDDYNNIFPCFKEVFNDCYTIL